MASRTSCSIWAQKHLAHHPAVILVSWKSRRFAQRAAGHALQAVQLQVEAMRLASRGLSSTRRWPASRLSGGSAAGAKAAKPRRISR